MVCAAFRVSLALAFVALLTLPLTARGNALPPLRLPLSHASEFAALSPPPPRNCSAPARPPLRKPGRAGLFDTTYDFVFL